MVIYVEYRLIPEHKYPAAYNDSMEATISIIHQHQKYNIDLNNLILMGDSAGGNLATVISQQLIEQNIARPRLQVLIYPILQFFDFTLPSHRIYFPAGVLGSINYENFKMFLSFFTGEEVDDFIFQNGHTTAAHKEKFSKFISPKLLPSHRLQSHNHIGRLFEATKLTCNSFLNGCFLKEHLNDTNNRFNKLTDILLSNKVSPLLVDDQYLKSNSPENTILITAEMDILRDEGFIYAERLRMLGKRVSHVHYENLFHGIFGLVGGPFKFDKAAEMIQHVAKLVTQTVEDLDQ